MANASVWGEALNGTRNTCMQALDEGAMHALEVEQRWGEWAQVAELVQAVERAQAGEQVQAGEGEGASGGRSVQEQLKATVNLMNLVLRCTRTVATMSWYTKLVYAGLRTTLATAATISFRVLTGQTANFVTSVLTITSVYVYAAFASTQCACDWYLSVHSVGELESFLEDLNGFLADHGSERAAANSEDVEQYQQRCRELTSSWADRWFTSRVARVGPGPGSLVDSIRYMYLLSYSGLRSDSRLKLSTTPYRVNRVNRAT